MGQRLLRRISRKQQKAMTTDGATKNALVKAEKPIGKSPLELNYGLIQGTFIILVVFCKKRHFLQGILFYSPYVYT